MNEQSIPVVAIFPNRGLAIAAIDELGHAGFSPHEIGMASPGEKLHEAATSTGALEQKAARGAVRGAIGGGVLGGVAGAIVAVAVPGLGPVLASGLLLSSLGGAAAGAALGTFLGPFIAMGFSREDAQRYEKEFRAGRTLVVVHTPNRQEDAIEILHNRGALYVEAASQALTGIG